MTSTSAIEGWYLDADKYYVPAEEAAEYPVRQGDLFPADAESIREWKAGQLVHPTCELGKETVASVQVIRVEPISRIEGDKQQAEVVAGFAEKDGKLRVAFANTFFLPPYDDSSVPLFSNFREITTVARDGFTADRRLVALSHDARVTFIRRELYFRYRIALTFDDVQKLEARRISNDKQFKGPRPAWAPLGE